MTLQKKIGFLIAFLGFVPFWQGHAVQSDRDLSIWPKAEQGYQRFVIQLPHLNNESENKVEIIPQKKIKIDCNLIRMHGDMQTHTLKGWGYDYYQLDKVNLPISTMMACPESSVRYEFVNINTNLPFLTYNSKLPIVVYVPKDIKLSYRIWSAQPLQKAKEK